MALSTDKNMPVLCQGSISAALGRIAKIREQQKIHHQRRAQNLVPINTTSFSVHPKFHAVASPMLSPSHDVDTLASLLSASSLSPDAKAYDGSPGSPPTPFPTVIGSPQGNSQPAQSADRRAGPSEKSCMRETKRCKAETGSDFSVKSFGRKAAKKASSRNCRRAKRHKISERCAFGDREASEKVRQKSISQSNAINVQFDINNLTAAKGGWVGLKRCFEGPKKIYSLKELLLGDSETGRPALHLFQWDDQ